jgi:phage I-like protein
MDMNEIVFASEVGGTDFVQNVSEIDVLMAGKYNSTRYGEFEITPDQLDEMVQEFHNTGAAGRRQVDFDHRANDKGDSRAAGWIQGLRRDGSKLKAAVEWTELGVDAIKKKVYRFQSAEYAPAKRSKTDGSVAEGHWLRGLTLTNRPFIEGMDPVTLSDDEPFSLAITPWSQAGPGGIGPAVSESENDDTALSPAQVSRIAKKIGIQWHNERFTIADLAHGIGEELEDHDTDDEITNALGGDKSKAAQLAVAHLRKDPAYYSRMEAMGLSDDEDNGDQSDGSEDNGDDHDDDGLVPAARTFSSAIYQPIATFDLTSSSSDASQVVFGEHRVHIEMGDEIWNAYALAEGSIGGTKLGSLPKSSYAWTDADGKGHLPYKDASGKVDASHVRNALARLNQVKGLSGAERDRVKSKLEAALKSIGGGDGAQPDKKGKSMSDDIRSLLQLSDEADDAAVTDAIRALVAAPKDGFVTLAEFQHVKEQAEESTRELHEWKRDSFLGDMVRAGKLLPKEVETYRELYDMSPEKIRKALDERTPVVKLGMVGTDDSGAKTANVMPTESDPGRRAFNDKVEEIMARVPGLSFGRAMELAEKELEA